MSSLPVYQPKNLDDALTWLANAPEARCLAGGTDIMVLLQMGASMKNPWLDIWKLDELRGIVEEDNSLWLGALTTYTQMIQNPLIKQYIPLLSEAARSVGAVAIQNRGTIGGNIVNASPAGDTLPVLLVHDATIELISSKGKRQVAATEFFLGYKKLDKRSDELISRICIPKQKKNEIHSWVKVGQRRAQAISKVMLAARALLENGKISFSKLSIGSVAPTPIRLFRVEEVLEGKSPSLALASEAKTITEQLVQPISDVRSTIEYRRTVSGNLSARFVRQLVS